MNEKQIEKIILDAAGNPSSGSLKDLAPVIAERLAAEMNPPEEKSFKPKRETRVISPGETR